MQRLSPVDTSSRPAVLRRVVATRDTASSPLPPAPVPRPNVSPPSSRPAPSRSPPEPPVSPRSKHLSSPPQRFNCASIQCKLTLNDSFLREISLNSSPRRKPTDKAPQTPAKEPFMVSGPTNVTRNRSAVEAMLAKGSFCLVLTK